MTLITNAAYDAHNKALSAQPIYVFEIVFNKGLEGVENVNDIYFGSDDISTIANFPYPLRYYPMLDAGSISGITQQVDPINGVSSIGSVSVDLIDYDHQVSAIIKAAADVGQGLRRQLCQVYKLFAGMDWADAIKSRTVFVDDLVLKSTGGKYHLTASDSQKQLKSKVFNGNTTVLNAAVVANGQVDVDMLDAVGFPMVPQPHFGMAGVCFFLLDDEILMATAKTGNVLTVAAGHRGMFATTPTTHDIYSDVVELIVLHENPITMALKIMTSSGLTGANGAYDVLPKHWGASFEKANVTEWLAVAPLLTGIDGSLNPLSGIQFEFVMDKSTECKKFIESEICKIIGCFPRVKGDGSLGLVAYNDLANVDKNSISAADTWTLDQVISWGDLDYGYKQMTNSVAIQYNEFPKLSGKFTRPVVFTDSNSYAKWGETDTPEYTTRGMLVQDVAQVYNRFQTVMARYSRPPLPITVKMLPEFSTAEIGDIKRLQLPLHDLLTGANLDRAFEVLRVNEAVSGAVVVDLIAQPETATVDFSTLFKPSIADVAYQIGTQSQAPGAPLAGPHVFTGNNSLTGQVWFEGDVIIPFGSILTIDGNTEIRATGTITVDGTIDGMGRGAGVSGAGWVNPAALVWGTPNNVTPPRGAGIGFLGNSTFGLGGSLYTGASLSGGPDYNLGASMPGLYQYTTPPLINPILSNQDPITNLWQSVLGLPALLQGASGGRGMLWGTAIDMIGSSVNAGVNARGGAGLLIMARGVFINGIIDLRGENGGNGLIVNGGGLRQACGTGSGGGSGGTAVVVAERDFSGLPVMDIGGTIIVDRGIGGVGQIFNTPPGPNEMQVVAGNWPSGGSMNGLDGIDGAIYTKIIG